MKKPTASTAVVRVSKLAVPRLDMKPAPPPTPRPPPSDFCSNTAPINVATIMRWMTITTVCISTFRRKPRRRGPAAGLGLRGLKSRGVTRLHGELSPPRDFRGNLFRLFCKQVLEGGSMGRSLSLILAHD